jgi:hypothetical protein
LHRSTQHRRSALQPGDTWFDRARDVQILAISPTNLPEGFPESALRLLHGRSEVIDPKDWVEVKETRWRYTPILNFGLRLGPQWLIYQGAEVEPAIFRPAVDQSVHEVAQWHDEDRSLYVNWNADDDLFRAYRTRPTAAVAFGFSDHRDAISSLIERPDRMPDLGKDGGAASELICRATVRDGAADTRTGFYAPAVSRYRLDTSHLNADRLSFSVHTLEYGITWNAKKRQLQRSDRNPGDGITFSIEIWNGHEMERVWS